MLHDSNNTLQLNLGIASSENQLTQMIVETIQSCFNQEALVKETALQVKDMLDPDLKIQMDTVTSKAVKESVKKKQKKFRSEGRLNTNEISPQKNSSLRSMCKLKTDS